MNRPKTEQTEHRTGITAHYGPYFERTVRIPNRPNSSFRVNSPNTEEFISSEQFKHRTVRTPKILKNSKKGEQSEQ